MFLFLKFKSELYKKKEDELQGVFLFLPRL